MGGDRLDYDGNTATDVASMDTTKIHLNSVISTPGARYVAANIGNFYTNSKLPSPEYIRVHINDIPEEIIKEYNITKYSKRDRWVYIKIIGALYGLKQAGKIADEDLIKYLKPHGYYPSKQTPGLWFHEERPISFTLMVDNLGVKYTRKEDALHLFGVLEKKYPPKIDWSGKKYIGIDLDWHYDAKDPHVILSMKGYVKKALKEYLWVKQKGTYGPTPFTHPDYSQRVQYVPEDTSPPLDAKGIKEVQQVVGKFLYKSRAIDNTIAYTLNELNIAAIKATGVTKKALDHLKDYLATNPEAQIIFRASDMQLIIDSDAAYLNAPKSRSRAGGYHFLGNTDGKLFNGPIFILAKIIKAVMSSAAEAKVGSLFINAQQAIQYIVTLEELGHPQAAVPLLTNNSTTAGFLSRTIKKKQSKAFDMQFQWLID